MTQTRFAATLVVAVFAAAASFAHAQAARTWVSGVGDDANPCSRTAPCKTLAGAISRTAPGGEIDALDPGGYGTVTITKSITIDGGGGAGWASILNQQTNGIVVSAGASDTVILRNISIDGVGMGTNGIKILQAGTVSIENVQISGNNAAAPNGRGISDQRTTGGRLFVTDTVIRNNSQSGIVLAPDTGATTIEASLHNVKVFANGNAGLAATLGAHVKITDSVLSGNTNYGLYMDQTAGDTFVSLSGCTLADNSVGISMGPGDPTLTLSDVSVTDNNTGMVRGTGPVSTYNNNRFTRNVAGNGPFVPGFTPVGPL